MIADSVRLAWPSEADQIGEVQRRAWTTSWPSELATALTAQLPHEDAAARWRQAIERPPGARFRVLVAVEQERVVACAATTPAEDEDAEPGVDGEIVEFVVDPVARHRGHGSRLLHACADTLRADGFTRASCWVATGDQELRNFLAAAGWQVDGATRELGTDDADLRLPQVRLHTALV